ncbi:MAG: hypothetical protein R3E99_00305 [Burkholderiaceae bacterium]
MDDLTDASRRGTGNLATPDNSRNCDAPDMGDLERAMPVERTSLPLAFTVITGIQPNRLTKVIGLSADGSMRKESSAMLSRGRAQRVVAADLNDLRATLDALTSAQAVAWGVTQDEAVDLCTQGDAEAQQAGAITRTRENFRFAGAPGVMMLDHDGLPDGELSALQFRDRLIAAAPVLADAPMLWRPSASAGCVAPDGRALSGLTRHRLYIPVADATLIPEAGKALEALLWATPGGGWCDVGVAGQRLPRCLVDVSVWQPERLDFAGPPVLVDGVTRVGVEGVIFGNAAAVRPARSDRQRHAGYQEAGPGRARRLHAQRLPSAAMPRGAAGCQTRPPRWRSAVAFSWPKPSRCWSVLRSSRC